MPTAEQLESFVNPIFFLYLYTFCLDALFSYPMLPGQKSMEERVGGLRLQMMEAYQNYHGLLAGSWGFFSRRQSL